MVQAPDERLRPGFTNRAYLNQDFYNNALEEHITGVNNATEIFYVSV